MLCEKCKQREATTLIRQSINGVQSEMHLCEVCAMVGQRGGDIVKISGNENLLRGAALCSAGKQCGKQGKKSGEYAHRIILLDGAVK